MKPPPAAAALIVLCALSCNDTAQPPDVLEASAFASVTAELLRTAPDRASGQPIPTDSLLQTAGTTRSEYRASVVWYSSTADRWNEVMKLVVATLDSTGRVPGTPAALSAGP